MDGRLPPRASSFRLSSRRPGCAASTAWPAGSPSHPSVLCPTRRTLLCCLRAKLLSLIFSGAKVKLRATVVESGPDPDFRVTPSM